MMKLTRIGMALVIVALGSGSAAAQSVTRGPWANDPNAAQYTQSCGSGAWSMRAVTVAAAGDSKAFKIENQWASTAQNQVFEFGQQIVAHTSVAGLICEGMTTSATVTTNAGTCNENCGYATFDSATSRSGVMNCHHIAAANTPYFFKVSSYGWSRGTVSSRNVTYRPFGCTTAADLASVGGGCATNAECGTGGVCSLSYLTPPKGVYLFWIPFTAGGVARVETCVQ